MAAAETQRLPHLSRSLHYHHRLILNSLAEHSAAIDSLEMIAMAVAQATVNLAKLEAMALALVAVRILC